MGMHAENLGLLIFFFTSFGQEAKAEAKAEIAVRKASGKFQFSMRFKARP